jgi:hypothetical protein
MIDPTQLPILLKALDFLFEEGHKILAERRERKKMETLAQNSDQPEPVRGMPPPDVHEKKEIKQDLIATKIDEILWQNHEEEVKHLVRLLEKHTRNYYILKEQHAEWGSALVPPHILSQMREKENSIIETREQLESVLSKVYKKDITLN